MNETVTIEWSEELARNAVATAYGSTLARPWVLPTAGIFMAGCGGISYTFYTQNPLMLVAAVIGLLFIGVSIRHRLLLRRLVRDAKRLSSD